MHGFINHTQQHSYFPSLCCFWFEQGWPNFSQYLGSSFPSSAEPTPAPCRAARIFATCLDPFPKCEPRLASHQPVGWWYSCPHPYRNWWSMPKNWGYLPILKTLSCLILSGHPFLPLNASPNGGHHMVYQNSICLHWNFLLTSSSTAAHASSTQYSPWCSAIIPLVSHVSINFAMTIVFPKWTHASIWTHSFSIHCS